MRLVAQEHLRLVREYADERLGPARTLRKLYLRWLVDGPLGSWVVLN